MTKKLAKIKYLPNNFEIIQAGDYVECAVSGKKINIEKLKSSYLPYYSQLKKDGFNVVFIPNVILIGKNG